MRRCKEHPGTTCQHHYEATAEQDFQQELLHSSIPPVIPNPDVFLEYETTNWNSVTAKQAIQSRSQWQILWLLAKGQSTKYVVQSTDYFENWIA